MEKITSRSNGLLVHMKKLAASAAYRREQGVYLCDSPKLLAEALKWHAPVREIAVTADVPLPPLPETVRAVEIPEDVMSSISPMKSPQGALFTVTLPGDRRSRSAARQPLHGAGRRAGPRQRGHHPADTGCL